MKNKKYLKNSKVMLFLPLILILIGSVFGGSGGLSVVLNNQNPDPVEPGNFVYLNMKVSNLGEDVIKGVSIEFLEDKNFKIADGYDKIKEVGLVPAFSSQENTGGYYIAKFKVYVSENTPQGLNTVSFRVKVDGVTYKYDFDILVQDNNPSLEIANTSIGTIEAGKEGKLKLFLKNNNNINLKNINVKLNLNDVEGKVLNTLSGSNKILIDNLKPNEIKESVFNLIVDPNADAKPYLVPLTITYEDNLGNVYTEELSVSVKVNSQPKLSFKLDSQEIYTKGKGKVTFAISNPGTSSIKGVEAFILDSEDYKVLDGGYQYIGDLNPDDFQTIQSTLYLNNDKKTIVKIKLTYTDSYNNKKEEIVEIPLKIYSQKELEELGIIPISKKMNYMIYIVSLIAFIIGYIIGKRKGRKKN